MKKKIIALCLIVVLAATAVIGGTLAYFTDTASKENVFTVGKLGIDLVEPNWDEDNAKNIVPGAVIPKDPTVIVDANSVPMYLRVTVAMPEEVANHSDFWKGAADAKILFNGQNTAFKCDGFRTVDGTTTYFLTYDGVIATSADAAEFKLFESVTFSTAITNAEDDVLYAVISDGEWNIDVAAYAIQATGVTNVKEAFANEWADVFLPNI